MPHSGGCYICELRNVIRFALVSPGPLDDNFERIISWPAKWACISKLAAIVCVFFLHYIMIRFVFAEWVRLYC